VQGGGRIHPPVARLANGILEPIGTRPRCPTCSVDVREDLDIQGRAGFYEPYGAFLDMVVTHLLQILGMCRALRRPAG